MIVHVITWDDSHIDSVHAELHLAEEKLAYLADLYNVGPTTVKLRGRYLIITGPDGIKRLTITSHILRK